MASTRPAWATTVISADSARLRRSSNQSGTYEPVRSMGPAGSTMWGKGEVGPLKETKL